MGGCQADGHEQVVTLLSPGPDAAVADRIGLYAHLHVAFVADHTVGRDISLAVVGVHVVGGQADRIVGFPIPLAVGLGHHIVGDHPPALADIELMGPVVVVDKLILGQAEPLEVLLDFLGNPRVVGECPHQSLLVAAVVGDDPLAVGVAALDIPHVAADVVGADREVVVGVGLAIGHPDRVPGDSTIARLEVAKEQFKLRLVVARWLGPRAAVVRHVGGAHAKVVGLHAAVAVAVGAGGLGGDQGEQAAGRIAGHDVGIDVVGELMLEGVGHADAVERFAIDAFGLAADVKRDASRGQQVALVSSVNEHPAGKAAASGSGDGFDPGALHLNAPAVADEPLPHDQLYPGLVDPVEIHLLGHMRLEGPHLLGTAVAGAAAALITLPLLVHPGVVARVVLGNATVELAREPADRRLVANVGGAEAAGGQATDMPARLDQHGRLPHRAGLDRRHDTARRATVDNEVVDGSCVSGSCAGRRCHCYD